MYCMRRSSLLSPFFSHLVGDADMRLEKERDDARTGLSDPPFFFFLSLPFFLPSFRLQPEKIGEECIEKDIGLRILFGERTLT